MGAVAGLHHGKALITTDEVFDLHVGRHGTVVKTAISEMDLRGRKCGAL
jgi:hypothetical protein